MKAMASSSTFDARCFRWMEKVPEALECRRELRDRSLNGHNLLRGIRQPGHGTAEVVQGSLDCCRLNHVALGVLLKVMADNACIFIPKVFILQGAMLEFHSNSGYPDPDTLGAAANSDGWGLKRMLSFLRRKWKRQEKSRESRHVPNGAINRFSCQFLVKGFGYVCVYLRTNAFVAWLLSSSGLMKL